MSPRFRLALLVLLVVGWTGCATTAPPPPAPPPVQETAPPPPPPPAPEPEPEVPLEPVVKPPLRPVPMGVFESQSVYPQADVTVWRMANGAQVIFRPMRVVPRRMSVLAVAPGGLGSVPADQMAAALDVGTDLSTGRLTTQEAQVYGDGTTDDLVDVLRGMAEVMTGGEPVSASLVSALIPEMVLDGLLSDASRDAVLARPAEADRQIVYAQQFGDPRRFTFIIIGDATAERVEQAVAEALAGLRPSMQAVLDEAPERAPWQVPSRADVVTLPSRPGPTEMVVAFRGEAESSDRALAALHVLATLVEEAITPLLPAEAVLALTPALDFEARVAELRVQVSGRALDDEALIAAITAVRNPSPTQLAIAREAAREAHLADLDTHFGWLDWLAQTIRYDHDTGVALDFANELRGVTATHLERLAASVLDADHMIAVVQPGE